MKYFDLRCGKWVLDKDHQPEMTNESAALQRSRLVDQGLVTPSSTASQDTSGYLSMEAIKRLRTNLIKSGNIIPDEE